VSRAGKAYDARVRLSKSEILDKRAYPGGQNGNPDFNHKTEWRFEWQDEKRKRRTKHQSFGGM
jgi:hypothetical protein